MAAVRDVHHASDELTEVPFALPTRRIDERGVRLLDEQLLIGVLTVQWASFARNVDVNGKNNR